VATLNPTLVPPLFSTTRLKEGYIVCDSIQYFGCKRYFFAFVFDILKMISSKDAAKYLNDFKFGVGVSGGLEAILHSANRVLSQRHEDGSLA
jgi:hypothetical protein